MKELKYFDFVYDKKTKRMSGCILKDWIVKSEYEDTDLKRFAVLIPNSNKKIFLNKKHVYDKDKTKDYIRYCVPDTGDGRFSLAIAYLDSEDKTKELYRENINRWQIKEILWNLNSLVKKFKRGLSLIAGVVKNTITSSEIIAMKLTEDVINVWDEFIKTKKIPKAAMWLKNRIQAEKPFDDDVGKRTEFILNEEDYEIWD